MGIRPTDNSATLTCIGKRGAVLNEAGMPYLVVPTIRYTTPWLLCTGL